MKNKPKKIRIDALLVERGLFESKTQAQKAISDGTVKINGMVCEKSGSQILENALIEIETEKNPYVSRGGFKLEQAVNEFQLDIKDKVCLDAGASTGGFTDCMLQNGAKKVYAVDVGYGQLAWKLRTDPKVIVIEKTNIRNASFEQIYKDINPSDSESLPEFCAMDLSFISITKVLENVKSLMRPNEIEIIALIKPQFEAGRDDVPKTGVVKDKAIHLKVIKNVVEFAYNIGLFTESLTYSPIKGPAGNIEYLIYLKDLQTVSFSLEQIEKVVNKANDLL
jgi:23S rRNA (cytidine1920-2'-O)/16S rRNA (cytidine1409-2'-O)-methyltransferase